MKKNMRNFLERNRWLKGVPNSLTICNSLCGFAAIINLLKIYSPDAEPLRILAISAFFILFAMIFDCLDGFAARILNAASMHGLQMDSLSDMVTFGVAPAASLVAFSMQLLPEAGKHYCLIWGFAAVYLGCAALRLATYNVHAMLEKKSSDKFSGLPSPGAAAALCTTFIFFYYANIVDSTYFRLVPFYGMLLGLLMVSRIQYQHFGKWLTTVKRSKIKIILVLLLISALVWKFYLTAFLIVNLYVIWGVFAAFLRRIGILKKIEPEEPKEV